MNELNYKRKKRRKKEDEAKRKRKPIPRRPLFNLKSIKITLSENYERD